MKCCCPLYRTKNVCVKHAEGLVPFTMWVMSMSTKVDRGGEGLSDERADLRPFPASSVLKCM